MQSKQLYLTHRNKHRESAKVRKQRNMVQMKEQIKTQVLNDMEISNLAGAEFKTLVIRTFKKLREGLSNIKKMQSEMKDSLLKQRPIYRKITVQCMKPRIKSIIWNIRKQKNNQSE